MNLRNVTIAVIIVSCLVIGSISYLTDIATNYNRTANIGNLNKTAIALNSYNKEAVELQETVTSFEITSTVLLDVPYTMIKTGWQTGKIMLTSWSVVGNMAIEVSEGINQNGVILPDWFIPTITAIMILMLVSIVIFAFFKWKFED